MNNNNKISRESFKQAIACFLSQEEVVEGMERYDKLAKYGNEVAQVVTLNSLGLKEASAGVSEYIAGQLARLGTGPKPETDAVKRFKQLVARLNSQIVKGGILINGEDLSTFAHEQAKIKVAPCLQDQLYTYTATASHTVDGKKYDKLALETIGVRTK